MPPPDSYILEPGTDAVNGFRPIVTRWCAETFGPHRPRF